MNIHPFLQLMVDKKASDLYFTADAPVQLRVDGQMLAVTTAALSAQQAQAAAFAVLNEQQQAEFQQELEVDLAYVLADVGRFRVNVFRQCGQTAMVMRYIPAAIPALASLNLPPVLADLILQKRGLLLMVGATGSGKSTTLAAMLNHRNQSQNGHILTIEDPIEFLHPNQKSIVNQRELGEDTHSYARALKSALREAPDVIQIGEIRERGTMEAAMELASTGHLAVSTLHANNAHQALSRIINLFPMALHKQLFMDLSMNLQAIISQRLVPAQHGGRVAAVEVMVVSAHLRELILNGRVDDIAEAMQASSTEGMQTFDQALFRLYEQGQISLTAALDNADSRTNLEARINFG